MTRKCVAVVVFGVNGIKLKPIRLRKSLYLLIPMEVAKLIGVTDKTKNTRYNIRRKCGVRFLVIYLNSLGKSKNKPKFSK